MDVAKNARQHITTDSAFERDMAYSRAVVDGDLVFVSGTTGFDYATMTISGDVADQADRCFCTIAEVLAQAGAALCDIVSVRYYVPDPGDIPAIAPVLRRHLGDVRPAATMVCTKLIDPRMKIEIEVTARRRC